MHPKTKRLIFILSITVIAGLAILLVATSTFTISGDDEDSKSVEGSDSGTGQRSVEWAAFESLKKKINSIQHPVGQGRRNAAISPVLLSPEHNLIYHPDRPRASTILILMMSYRGSTCEASVNSVFDSADRPDQIYVGLVEQREPNDPSCISKSYALCNQSAFCATDQIRVRRVDPKAKFGPSYARAIAASAFRNEKYVLMADSRTLFAKHWDTRLIDAYQSVHAAQVADKKVSPFVLSGRSVPVDTVQDAKLEQPTGKSVRMCLASVKEAPALETLNGSLHSTEVSFEPLFDSGKHIAAQQPFISFEFLFAEGALLAEVPLDPGLKFLSSKDDECLYSMRLWAADYLSYGVPELVTYRVKDSNTQQPPSDPLLRKASKWRMLLLSRSIAEVHLPPELESFQKDITADEDRFKLGGEKRASHYFQAMGVDWKALKLTKDWCQG